MDNENPNLSLPADQKITDYLALYQNKRLLKPSSCQSCKKPGRLIWHGSYKRSVTTLHQVITIPIRRLFCALCRHTFGLLPAFISKWHRYAKEVILTALQWLKSKTFDFVADQLTQQCGRCVAPLTLYFWRKKFS